MSINLELLRKAIGDKRGLVSRILETKLGNYEVYIKPRNAEQLPEQSVGTVTFKLETEALTEDAPHSQELVYSAKAKPALLDIRYLNQLGFLLEVDETLVRTIHELKKELELPKIYSFYSYKGGMGRSTFAYLMGLMMALEGKRILLIDMDFEAPGAMNWPRSLPSDEWSILDYLMATEGGLTREGSSPISRVLEWSGLVETGIGELFIVPAIASGKLELSPEEIQNPLYSLPESRFNDYVHDLAKISFNAPEFWANSIPKVLEEVCRDIAADGKGEIDAVFLDLRTGVNDLWGTVLTCINDVSVSFYSSTPQSVPGFTFYLDWLLTNKARTGFFPAVKLVNSIVSPNMSQKSKEQFLGMLGDYKESRSHFVLNYDRNILDAPRVFERIGELEEKLLSTQEDLIETNSREVLVNYLRILKSDQYKWLQDILVNVYDHSQTDCSEASQ